MLGAIMYFCIWAVLQVPRYLLWNWKVEGLDRLPPRTSGMVLAMNHLHWLDILILGASLPLKYRPWWIAKVELLDKSALNWWFLAMQVIPIHRGKRDMAALNAAEAVLRERHAVLVIFPEGTRSRSGQLQEGRGGAVRIAARSDVPIVPAAVWGTERGVKGAFRRTPIRMVFGEPYRPEVHGESIPFNRMNELTDEMMVRIAGLLPEDRRGYYRDRTLQVTHDA